jgi:hypothetical protein
MPYADEKRVMGNYGVKALMKELSKSCLVRPVLEGTDIGIDLYCETLENPGKGGRPFLHFWVQVKTMKERKPLSNGAMSFPFEVRHLKYWSRQPVPVFAFLIHVPNWPKTDSIYPFYIIDIKKHTFRNKGLLNGKSHKLRNDLIIHSEEQLSGFILNVIPYITAAHKVPEGIVSSIPTIDPKYEIKPVMDNCYTYLYNILWQIRRTSTSAIIGSYDHASDNDEVKRDIRKLRKIVNAFTEDKHYDTPSSLGLAFLMDKNYTEAKGFFER